LLTTVPDIQETGASEVILAGTTLTLGAEKFSAITDMDIVNIMMESNMLLNRLNRAIMSPLYKAIIFK
jgi:hypothetical protein